MRLLKLYAGSVLLACASQQQTGRIMSPSENAQFDKLGAIDSLMENRISLAMRVWGFAKYHLPRICRGEVNWDAEFGRLLVSISNARSHDETTTAVVQLLLPLGAPEQCTKCSSPRDSTFSTTYPDINWIRDTALLGPQLSSRLVEIYIGRWTGIHQHYVEFDSLIGNPSFSGELDYDASQVAHRSIRLLAVARFWNAVEYWYPYRDTSRASRLAVLGRSIQRVWDVPDFQGYSLAMLQIAASLRDSHAEMFWARSLRPPYGGLRVPATIRISEERFVIEDTLPIKGQASNPLHPGDVVRTIDGVESEVLRDRWKPLYPHSSTAALNRDIARQLLRGAGATATMVVERDQKRIALQVPRTTTPYTPQNNAINPSHDLPGGALQELGDRVTYLKLSTARRDNIALYVRAARDAQVFVFDARGYPKDPPVALNLARHFVERPTPFVRIAKATGRDPGRYSLLKPYELVPKEPFASPKVIILVDELTLSAAEYSAMILRAIPGALVVGSHTAGGNGNVSTLLLPGTLTVRWSGNGIFTPTGAETQRVGIVPDVIIHPTPASIAAKVDRVLDSAVSLALGRPFRLGRIDNAGKNKRTFDCVILQGSCGQ